MHSILHTLYILVKFYMFVHVKNQQALQLTAPCDKHALLLTAAQPHDVNRAPDTSLSVQRCIKVYISLVLKLTKICFA